MPKSKTMLSSPRTLFSRSECCYWFVLLEYFSISIRADIFYMFSQLYLWRGQTLRVSPPPPAPVGSILLFEYLLWSLFGGHNVTSGMETTLIGFSLVHFCQLATTQPTRRRGELVENNNKSSERIGPY
jgi:hypothetical protein